MTTQNYHLRSSKTYVKPSFLSNQTFFVKTINICEIRKAIRMDYDELECAEPIKNQVCPRCLGECWILKGRVGCWFCGGTQVSPGMSQLSQKPGPPDPSRTVPGPDFSLTYERLRFS